MLLSLPKGVVRVGAPPRSSTWPSVTTMDEWTSWRLAARPFASPKSRIWKPLTRTLLLEGEVDYLDDREAPANPRIRQELVELYEVCHTILFDDYPKILQPVRNAPCPTLSRVPCPWT